jgi:hypothetical protein
MSADYGFDIADQLNSLGSAQFVFWDDIRPTMVAAAKEIKRLREENSQLMGLNSSHADKAEIARLTGLLKECWPLLEVITALNRKIPV